MTHEIYFIYAPEVGRFKVGRTRSLDQRLSSLRGSSPCVLDLLYVASGCIPELEAFCHQVVGALGFKPLHGEWFEGDIDVETCETIVAEAKHLVDIAIRDGEEKELARIARRHEQEMNRIRIATTKEFFREKRKRRENRGRAYAESVLASVDTREAAALI